jgi:hypothetical protein
MTRNNFREQLERRRNQAESGPVEAETGAKPASEMTDDEISAALTASRRELLDLRHEELREREKARVSGGVVHEHGRSLPDVFRKRPNFK